MNRSENPAPNPNRHQPEEGSQEAICETVKALIPAYALGATDPEEEALIKAHLEQCPEALAELASYTALNEALLYSAPPAAAPPELGERLRRALHPTADAAPQGRTWPGLLEWIAGLFSGLATPSFTLGQAVTGLAVLALVVTNFYWGAQVRALQAKQAQLAQELDRQLATMGLIMTAEEIQRVNLPPAQADSPAHAELVWAPDNRVAMLYAESFPPLPPDKAYQLWLIRDGERISGGLFRVNEHGQGVLVVEAPEPLEHFEGFGITPEPATGSPGPTASPVVKG